MTKLTILIEDNSDIASVRAAIGLIRGVLSVQAESSSLEPITPHKPPKAQQNALLDALGCLDSPNTAEITSWGPIVKALSLIKAVCPGVTPEEIQRRAGIYRQIMGASTMITSTALAKHWGRCGVAPDNTPKPANTPHWKLAQNMKVKLASHPGNPQWVGYCASTATAEQQNEFIALKERCRLLEEEP